MIEHLGLTFRSDYYYIKRSRVVQRIIFDNRTFFAKFERIDKPLTEVLIAQHLRDEITIAASLLDDKGCTRYILFEYKGQESGRFMALLRYFCKSGDLGEPLFYKIKKADKLEAFIKVEPMPIAAAEKTGKWLDQKLKEKMNKSWKMLPLTTLPPSYNIVTLPIEKIESW